MEVEEFTLVLLHTDTCAVCIEIPPPISDKKETGSTPDFDAMQLILGGLKIEIINNGWWGM
jgi:hypothetical protein